MFVGWWGGRKSVNNNNENEDSYYESRIKEIRSWGSGRGEGVESMVVDLLLGSFAILVIDFDSVLL